MPTDIFFFRIVLAVILGGLIGWQRHHMGKAAGVRTFALVAAGSALFTMLSAYAFPAGDSARIASQILTGIGFIGAGIILHKRGEVEGLTTAASFWAVAALGMSVGIGWEVKAMLATAILFIVLSFPDKK